MLNPKTLRKYLPVLCGLPFVWVGIAFVGYSRALDEYDVIKEGLAGGSPTGVIEDRQSFTLGYASDICIRLDVRPEMYCFGQRSISPEVREKHGNIYWMLSPGTRVTLKSSRFRVHYLAIETDQGPEVLIDHDQKIADEDRALPSGGEGVFDAGLILILAGIIIYFGVMRLLPKFSYFQK